MVDQVDDGDDQVCNENRGEEKVEWRIKFAVILQILRGPYSCSDTFSFRPGVGCCGRQHRRTSVSSGASGLGTRAFRILLGTVRVCQRRNIAWIKKFGMLLG